MSLPVAILAGGLATRLRPLTGQMPKSLIEVAGLPFIVHQLKLLRQNGLTEAVLCLGYLGEQIQAEIGDGQRLGMRITCIFDGPELLGTGGALRRALPSLGNAFFMLYGDCYLECDYQAIEKAFHEKGKLGLMTVFKNMNQWDNSNIVFENGRIVSYNKINRVPEMKHIDYGVSVLQAATLSDYPAGKPFDLVTVYQDLLSQNQLAGFEVYERFYEIGSPAGLEETRRHISEKEHGTS
ncbi:MAG: nucleotidyltransferase family protein [Candidatus Wallbacteria bacterium]|nr:nucleotidyltransferase family protein [Candidatus Wallbacteria bacterium]